MSKKKLVFFWPRYARDVQMQLKGSVSFYTSLLKINSKPEKNAEVMISP